MENDHEKITTCVVCKKAQGYFFVKKNGFELYRCGECGHIFPSPFLKHDSSFSYDEDYFSGAKTASGYIDYDRDKEPMRPVFVRYMKEIESLCSEKGRLLDVGAATGFFVEIAKKRGWNACGVEISEYATEVAQKKGRDVVCGTLGSGGTLEEGSFRVITLWDVLEHFQDPHREIHLCSKLLTSGGILAISTPDSGSWYARITGKRWPLLVPPEHLHYFTQKSIRIFLENNGFEIEKITKIGKTFTLEYTLLIASGLRNFGFLRTIVTFLKKYPRVGSFAIPINLHDNMVVIARRT